MHEAEDIPNEDRLYYRVHQAYLSMGELKPGVFREIGATLIVTIYVARYLGPSDFGLLSIDCDGLSTTNITDTNYSSSLQ